MNRTDFRLDEYGYSEDAGYLEYCLGQIVQALVESGGEDIASLLVSCRLSIATDGQLDQIDGKWVRIAYGIVHGPMSAISMLRKMELREDLHDLTPSEWRPEDLVRDMIGLVLGPGVCVTRLDYQLEGAPLGSGWRDEIRDNVRNRDVSNQGLPIKSSGGKIQEYGRLRYRSVSEMKIARALDERKVLYLPNCAARLNRGAERVNREPDFLICQNGKWGILQVDGSPFHPATRAAEDHAWDTLFQQHGVILVKHYDAHRCFVEPALVVAEFLDLLEKS